MVFLCPNSYQHEDWKVGAFAFYPSVVVVEAAVVEAAAVVAVAVVAVAVEAVAVVAAAAAAAAADKIDSGNLSASEDASAFVSERSTAT